MNETNIMFVSSNTFLSLAWMEASNQGKSHLYFFFLLQYPLLMSFQILLFFPAPIINMARNITVRTWNSSVKLQLSDMSLFCLFLPIRAINSFMTLFTTSITQNLKLFMKDLLALTLFPMA
jgi:hypothetical protein